MSLWPLIIALQFITKLRFPSSVPVHEVIIRRYGVQTWRGIKRWEKQLNKWSKAKLDVCFLERCVIYNLFPKFVNFKLYRRELHKKNFYKLWRTQLLEQELKKRQKDINKEYVKLMTCYEEVKGKVSMLDFNHILHYVHKLNNSYVNETTIRHAKKIYTLGGYYSFPTVNSQSTITNLSSYVLSKKEKYLLSFGLEHCLPPRVSEFDLKLHFELLLERLLKETPYHDSTELVGEFKELFFNCNNGMKGENVIKIFSKDDMEVLKNFKRKTDIVTTKPDKGKGVVLLNRSDYRNKAYDILNDVNSFRQIKNIDPLKQSLLMEDKINRKLKQLKEQNYISDSEYSKLYASGSCPGKFYGLPKLHKPNVPLRPVITSYSSPSYKLAKFLIPFIETFSIGDYTVANTFDFVKELWSLNINETFVMASFDVKSLFTSIPLSEVMEIVTDLLYEDEGSFRGMPRSDFKKLLKLVLDDNYFMFEENLFQQVDGLTMGNPLSATLANIFMLYYERTWLNECPLDFKPLLYRRYVDDTFVIFDDYRKANQFLDYVNCKHAKIKFTCEVENAGCIPFLDSLIKRENNSYCTEVYRKPTHTGLGLNFLSFCSMKFKINAIKTLLYRAYNISSNFIAMHKEFQYLVKFFKDNGFPENIIFSNIRSFLEKMNVNKDVSFGPNKLPVYQKLPFISDKVNDYLNREIRKLVSKHFPQININLIFFNDHKIRNYASHKDKTPTTWCSKVVYKFCCPVCNLLYIGSTRKCLIFRIFEHSGRSFRTSNILTRPVQSSIRNHCESVCNRLIKVDDFTILFKGEENEIRIAESLYIKKLEPKLNQDSSSFSLRI